MPAKKINIRRDGLGEFGPADWKSKEFPVGAAPAEPYMPRARDTIHPIIENYGMQNHFSPEGSDVLEELALVGVEGEFAKIKRRRNLPEKTNDLQVARASATEAYTHMYLAACHQARVEPDPRLPPDRAGQLLAAVQFGMSRYGAAAIAGVPRRLFKRWEMSAELGSRYAETLIGLIEVAEAHLEQYVIDLWMAQMGDSWQSAQAFASRRLRGQGWSEMSVADLPWDQLQSMSEEELAGVIGTSVIDIQASEPSGNGAPSAPVLVSPDGSGDEVALSDATRLLDSLLTGRS
jgi:hypothetical protein